MHNLLDESLRGKAAVKPPCYALHSDRRRAITILPRRQRQHSQQTRPS